MTTAVIVSRFADRDMIEIIATFEREAGGLVPRKFARKFAGAIDLVSEHPGHSARRPRLGRSIRVSAVYPYLMIYEHVRGQHATVLRVLHGRRKITRSLMQR